MLLFYYFVNHSFIFFVDRLKSNLVFLLTRIFFMKLFYLTFILFCLQCYTFAQALLPDAELEKLPTYQNIESAIRKLDTVYKLDLSNQKLTALPVKIGLLKKVQFLDISGNLITELPKELIELKNIQELRISRCPNMNWQQAFGIICQFSHLEKLTIDHSQVIELPACIGNLKTLKWLYADGNKISNIPKEIGQLTQLRVLGLSMNVIKELPMEIGNLHNLEELHLTRNNITIMPRSIDKCTNMHLLILSDNAIDPKEKERVRNALPHARVQF